MSAPAAAGLLDTGSPIIEVYEAGLRATLRGDQAGWRVRHDDGRSADLPLAEWAGDQRPGDVGLLSRSLGPTVDLGCGPGRLTTLLTRRGVPALGVDIAPYAVMLTRSRGGLAMRRDLFEPLPGEGRWQHLLLADGNIGIGGDPATLLRRCAQLVRPGGSVLCETGPPGAGLRQTRTRLEPPAGPASQWFPGPRPVRRQSVRWRMTPGSSGPTNGPTTAAGSLCCADPDARRHDRPWQSRPPRRQAWARNSAARRASRRRETFAPAGDGKVSMIDPLDVAADFEPTTDDLETLTGRKPRTSTEFASDHARWFS